MKLILVGGGFTSLSILFFLLKKHNSIKFKEILLIDDSENMFGRGNYIKNDHGNYYLNSDLNSVNLSVEYPDYNIHNWLSKNKTTIDLCDDYLNRKNYGDYLEYCFYKLSDNLKKIGIKLHVFNDNIYDLKYNKNVFTLFGKKNIYFANKLVLSTGIGISNSLSHLNINYSSLKKKKILIVGSSLSFIDVLRNINVDNNEVYFCSKDKLLPKIRLHCDINIKEIKEELFCYEIITIKILDKILKKYIKNSFINYVVVNANYCNDLKSLNKNINNPDIFSYILCNSNDFIDDIWLRFDNNLKKLIIKYYYYFSSYRNPMSRKSAEILIDYFSNKKIKYIDSEFCKLDNNIAHFKNGLSISFDKIIMTKGFTDVKNRELFYNIINRNLINMNRFNLGVEVNYDFQSVLCENLFCIGNPTFGEFIHVNSIDILKKHSFKLSNKINE